LVLADQSSLEKEVEWVTVVGLFHMYLACSSWGPFLTEVAERSAWGLSWELYTCITWDWGHLLLPLASWALLIHEVSWVWFWLSYLVTQEGQTRAT